VPIEEEEEIRYSKPNNLFKLHYLVLEDLWKLTDKVHVVWQWPAVRTKHYLVAVTTEIPEAKTRELGYQVSYVISAQSRHYNIHPAKTRCKITRH